MRIIIASHERSTRQAIGMLVNAQSDLDVVADVGDVADMMASIKTKQPDVVVLDWDHLGTRIQTITTLLDLFENPPALVALGVHEDARHEAIASGAAAFACKGDPPEGLLNSIRKSHQL